MGQFKPMVKMQTTEPSVELKLKKGGAVAKPAKAMNGGALGTASASPVGARGGMAPVARPTAPSVAARRRAMAGLPAMKEGGESKAEHKAEMKKMGALEKEMKSHESKPASKAHKGLKTGGVVNGQGGFKTGGVVKGNGGYKTGGVVLGEGGFKKGGSAKKAFATGGAVNDSGKPVAMPKKPASKPVSNDRQSGTFKKGGKVKMAEGGDLEDLSKGAYDKSIGPSEDDMDIARAIRGIPGKLFRGAKKLVGMDSKPKAGSGAVTETEKSITVEPAKKRGGSVKC